MARDAAVLWAGVVVGRIRTIKPDHWVDDVMAALDPVTRLLYIGLWNFVDDEGYIQNKPLQIKMMVFPGNDYDVQNALVHLLQAGRIGLFDSDQGELLQVLKFREHQKISHPSPTKFTGIAARGSVNTPEPSGALAPSRDISSRKGKERKGRGKEVQPYAALESEFDEFWKAFPRKQGKQPAKVTYLKVRSAGADRAKLLAGAEAYAKDQAGNDVKKIKMAQGWLNDARWDDDFSQPVVTSPLAPRSLDPVEHAHRWLPDGTCMLCPARRDREDTW